MTQGLFAEYLFNNGSLIPSVGSVIPINTNASSASDRFGCPHNAMTFSGNAYLDFGDSFDNYFTANDSSFSISLWFKLFNAGSVSHAIFQKSADGVCGESQREMGVVIGPTQKLRIGIYFTGDLNNYFVTECSTAFNDTLWHHVVINYDGSIDTGGGVDRLEVYVDNVPETLTIISATGSLGTINNGTAHTAIGNQLNSSGSICGTNSEQFEGYLDDYRFYNRLLQPFEVDLLFNESPICCEALGVNDSISTDVNSVQVYQTNSTYQWLDCSTMSPISGEVNQFYFPDSNGTYACVINFDDCIDTTDCINFSDQLAVDELTAVGNINIYPNPTNDDFNINLGQFHKKVEVQVVNILGEVIHRKSYSNCKVIEHIELPKTPGIYGVIIAIPNTEQVIFRVIKR
ncbi:MAG: T9SS type A sorting domain-containing protein [Crocinitomicaceae bacterium]|nr:T9SS type A sorting domain-containing protein [Crocinitomicaceae bacterium]